MVSIGHARSKYLYFAGATAPINSGHEVFGLAAAISLLEHLRVRRVTVRPNPISYAGPLRWTPERHLMTKNSQRLTLLATSISYVLLLLVPSST
jgi:hypothetical protein